MQETNVAWDPIIVDRQMPWQNKLFVLYLLLVLGISIIRSVGMARQLWLGGLLSKSKKPPDASFLYAYEMCASKAVGIKRMAVLTLILAFVMLTDGVTNILVGIAQEKQFWLAAAAGGLAEVGVMVTLGLLVGAVLYGLSSWCEGILARRRALWVYSRSNDHGV
ncbi:MAG: hypothetical protein HY010_02530 [Acidobacteria bacterium]|nr:hypothetical protein [Acidobacteriota bacterium]